MYTKDIFALLLETKHFLCFEGDQMRTFQVDDRTFSGYLAGPAHGSGPGVVVLHAWWGLTEPFRQVCDRLAAAGFVSGLAPDLYHGKTTASVEEAEALGEALDQDEERGRGDIAAAIQFLRQQEATQADGRREARYRWICARRRLRAGHVRHPGRGDRRRRDLLCLLPRTRR